MTFIKRELFTIIFIYTKKIYIFWITARKRIRQKYFDATMKRVKRSRDDKIGCKKKTLSIPVNIKRVTLNYSTML